VLAHADRPALVVPDDEPPGHRTSGARSAVYDHLAQAQGATSLHERPPLRTPYVAPRNPIEQTIAGLWQEVLGIDTIGIDDNFFELGGESLLATQLAVRIRGHFGVDLVLQELFAEPTVLGVYKQIARGMAATPAGGGVSEPELVAVPRDARQARRSASGVVYQDQAPS
jgi:acyl carrier protein